MLIAGVPRRTIWEVADGSVEIIDQTLLPHAIKVRRLGSLDDVALAVSKMWVRGAPLIGITAAYGVVLALRADPLDASVRIAHERLAATRPTAVNLKWALDRLFALVLSLPVAERAEAALGLARAMVEEDVIACRRIGDHGADLLEALHKVKRRTLNVLTHCNAGWLAAVDWGTALAPIYVARERGIPLHIWVDETRPRNQGAALTAFELGHEGIDHTIIVDNAGGHLMQHDRVDLCLVGADRITRRGDVANKVGTYLKALAARESGVPFYVAAPTSTIDWSISDGVREITIEERDEIEVTHLSGVRDNGEIVRVRIAAPGSPAANFAFDVTPASLVSGIITECGIVKPISSGLSVLRPADHWQARHSS